MFVTRRVRDHIYPTLRASLSHTPSIAFRHAPPNSARKKFRHDSNFFGFIRAGVSDVVSYKRNVWYNLSCLLQTYCRLSIIKNKTKQKRFVSWQFFETHGVTRGHYRSRRYQPWSEQEPNPPLQLIVQCQSPLTSWTSSHRSEPQRVLPCTCNSGSTDRMPHTPSTALRHLPLPPKEGCRKPVLGVCGCPWLTDSHTLYWRRYTPLLGLLNWSRKYPQVRIVPPAVPPPLTLGFRSRVIIKQRHWPCNRWSV